MSANTPSPSNIPSEQESTTLSISTTSTIVNRPSTPSATTSRSGRGRFYKSSAYVATESSYSEQDRTIRAVIDTPLESKLKYRKDADRYRGGNGNVCIPCEVEIMDIVRGMNVEIWTAKCNKCQKWGHTANHCPVSVSTSLFEIILSQHFPRFESNPNHLYLDSGANFSSYITCHAAGWKTNLRINQ